MEQSQEYCTKDGFPILWSDLLQADQLLLLWRLDIDRWLTDSPAVATGVDSCGRLTDSSLATGSLLWKQVERAKPWGSDAGCTLRTSGQRPLVRLFSLSLAIVPGDKHPCCHDHCSVLNAEIFAPLSRAAEQLAVMPCTHPFANEDNRSHANLPDVSSFSAFSYPAQGPGGHHSIFQATGSLGFLHASSCVKAKPKSLQRCSDDGILAHAGLAVSPCIIIFERAAKELAQILR